MLFKGLLVFRVPSMLKTMFTDFNFLNSWHPYSHPPPPCCSRVNCKCIWGWFERHAATVWLCVGKQLWVSCSSSSGVPMFISSFTDIGRWGIHFTGVNLSRSAVGLQPAVGTEAPRFSGYLKMMESSALGEQVLQCSSIGHLAKVSLKSFYPYCKHLIPFK